MRLLVVIALGSLVVGAAVTCTQRVGEVIDPLKGECLTCDSAELLARCSDLKDNDRDLLTDCQDPDCEVFPKCTAKPGPENTEAACKDGIDNDGNKYIDCLDNACVATPACRTATQGTEADNVACSDGLDSDWNGYIDCKDRNCQIPGVSVCEGSDATCSDKKDNDGNGFTDCGDFSCSKSTTVTVCK